MVHILKQEFNSLTFTLNTNISFNWPPGIMIHICYYYAFLTLYILFLTSMGLMVFSFKLFLDSFMYGLYV